MAGKRTPSGEAPDIAGTPADANSGPEPAVLTAQFFNRPADVVARELIGQSLVRRLDDGCRRAMVIETEAYVGPHDLACHAARGRTGRTEVMFGQPGTLYVYFIYGMHWMLNVVTGAKDYGAAVLIRGVEEVSGPGRLTARFKIDKSLNGQPASVATGLWFERNPSCGRVKVLQTPRIGVDYAGPLWAGKKLRFVLAPEPLRRRAAPRSRSDSK